VIAGGTYSADPAKRFLIVNGQVVREGADLGGGIRLTEIRPESAVLSVQGRAVVVFF
jgi:general secretion pathway protein B